MDGLGVTVGGALAARVRPENQQEHGQQAQHGLDEPRLSRWESLQPLNERI